MNIFKNPDFVNQYKFPYGRFEDIPKSVFDEINFGLTKLQHAAHAPIVSILIPAWNEEVNLLTSIASISKMKTNIPIELIVINNNSTDKTQETIDRLHVKGFFEGAQGWGPARQLGLENALGKYILLADADCIYPDSWVNEMVKVLAQKDVVCVYGRYSFISEPGFSRWKLSLLESMKDVIAEVRHINRPYFNSYGMSMGFIKEFGLKVGFVKYYFRGEDGQMCLGLMKYGKVKQVRTNKARVWTGPRTLQRDGGFYNALKNRLIKEVKRFFGNFSTRVPLERKYLKNTNKDI
ncbi:MAG: glycosyltransferase family 2 protein [Mucilaginibacter sp.]|uniref:glycosyltransferase family 2 protein n=1 Tax=Mucilaginibacter sp. TaxID=1882438 RepID=UPI0034E39787